MKQFNMAGISQPDYRFTAGGSVLGVQMLFVAFGALVLVPLLTGLDPNMAIFTAGAVAISCSPGNGPRSRNKR